MSHIKAKRDESLGKKMGKLCLDEREQIAASPCDNTSDSVLNLSGNIFPDFPSQKCNFKVPRMQNHHNKTYKDHPNRILKNPSKMETLLGKIKNRKAACESDTKKIWQNIEKQHKMLFMYEESPSEFVYKSNHTYQHSRSNTPARLSKSQYNPNVRSQSVDRILPSKANAKANSAKHNESIVNSKSAFDISINSEGFHSDEHLSRISTTPYLFYKESRSSCSSNEMNNPRSHSQLQEVTEDSPLDIQRFSSISAPFNLDEVDHTNSLDNLEELERNYNHQIATEGNVKNDEKYNNHMVSINATTKHKKPIYINKTNTLTKDRAALLRSRSSQNVHAGVLPPNYKRGQIPKYLLDRKAEVQKQLEAAKAIDPNCPPGHCPLPEEERKNTLDLLRKGQVEVVQQLAALPLVQDTLRVRRRKQSLEEKLNQIEEGIVIFSQPKVYVLNGIW